MMLFLKCNASIQTKFLKLITVLVVSFILSGCGTSDIGSVEKTAKKLKKCLVEREVADQCENLKVQLYQDKQKAIMSGNTHDSVQAAIKLAFSQVNGDPSSSPYEVKQERLRQEETRFNRLRQEFGHWGIYPSEMPLFGLDSCQYTGDGHSYVGYHHFIKSSTHSGEHVYHNFYIKSEKGRCYKAENYPVGLSKRDIEDNQCKVRDGLSGIYVFRNVNHTCENKEECERMVKKYHDDVDSLPGLKIKLIGTMYYQETLHATVEDEIERINKEIYPCLPVKKNHKLKTNPDID